MTKRQTRRKRKSSNNRRIRQAKKLFERWLQTGKEKYLIRGLDILETTNWDMTKEIEFDWPQSATSK